MNNLIGMEVGVQVMRAGEEGVLKVNGEIGEAKTAGAGK
jgi:hypothetical protein